MMYTDYSNEVGRLPISQMIYDELDKSLGEGGDFSRYEQLQNELDLIERYRNGETDKGKKQST